MIISDRSHSISGITDHKPKESSLVGETTHDRSLLYPSNTHQSNDQSPLLAHNTIHRQQDPYSSVFLQHHQQQQPLQPNYGSYNRYDRIDHPQGE